MLPIYEEVNTLVPKVKIQVKVFGRTFTLLQEHREVTINPMVSDNSHISQPEPFSSTHSSLVLDGRSAKGLFEHFVKLFFFLLFFFFLLLLCSGE